MENRDLMKATEAKFLDFLKKSPQFVIPIYQRTYSWTTKECRQLWDDVVRCGSSDKIAGYPASDPQTPENLAATIYEALGLPRELMWHDFTGRPHPLYMGSPISGLM